jgi:hypothetical protein
LPPELGAAELTIAESRPQPALSLCRIAAKRHGVSTDLAADWMHHVQEQKKTLTQPSPAKAGEG